MDSLNDTDWDVLIAGTGLRQSLLALALSRSGKKILHIDKNDYYGGAEAALSLQEAEEWVNRYQQDESPDSATLKVFGGAILNNSGSSQSERKLSASRAYSLALAPQLIYTDSKLLNNLVSSKVYRQLEFLAMGNWWIYSKDHDSTHSEDSLSSGKLVRVPTNREDVAFSDSGIDLRSKRLVMKVLRFIIEFEEHSDIWEPFLTKPFSEFLSQHFKLSSFLVDLFFGLSLSTSLPEDTMTEAALPRVARHLRSIGRLGPGFSSVIPKWGGLSEISQVACRSGAVGGAVYMLGTGIQNIQENSQDGDSEEMATVKLSNGDTVKAKIIVGSLEDLPGDVLPSQFGTQQIERLSYSVFIISSPLKSLFPQSTEGTPSPAGSVVIFPAGNIEPNSNPICLVLHSSETGDCPKDQCIIYAATKYDDSTKDRALLENSIKTLLASLDNEAPPVVLWSMYYWRNANQSLHAELNKIDTGRILFFSHLSIDLAFDDTVFDQVREVWAKIMGSKAIYEEFLTFEDRETEIEEDED